MRQRPAASNPVQPDNSGLIQDLFRRYTTVKTVKSLSPQEARNGLQALLENLDTEKKLMLALFDGVTKYADKNLNKVGNLYTNEAINIGSSTTIAPKRSVKIERVTAVNRLLELLSITCGKDVYDYITTPAFQDLIGSNEVKLSFWHAHLAANTEAFILGYQEYTKICTNEQLLMVLTQVDVRGFVQASELAALFWHYDPMLMAEIIVKVYARQDFTDFSELGKIDYTGLQHLLARDPLIVEMVNKVRKNIFKSQVLPPDVLTPGKNDVYEESLNRFQRFQFNDTTIFALEYSLHQEFGHLMVNNIVGDDGKRIKPLDNSAPYHFYLLSAARYMLIDPSKKNPEHMTKRFADFCQDVRSLMWSIKRNKHNKPIIVCGISNLEGDHYVPFFTYQHPGSCPSVLTQDPSARTYSDEELLANPKLEDSKVNTLKKVEKAFKKVFISDGCRFLDHDIDQMLRQFHCGSLAYTTLHDAMSTALSNQALLTIDEQYGVLRLNTSQLSVQGEHVGVDAYTRKLVYSAQLEKDSLANRASVQAVLERMVKVCAFTQREGNIEDPLDYRDTFVVSKQTPVIYNYFEEVDNQNKQDAREFNLSSLCSHLMSSDEGKAVIDAVVTSFRHKLARPSETLVMQFIKKTIDPVELSTLTSAHGGNLRKVCAELVVLLLKEKMPKQFITSFTDTVLAKLPDSFDLDAEALVAEFLKENATIYNDMTTHPQRIIKREMLNAAHDAVNAKLLSLHLERFKEYYNQSVGYQLQILLMTDINDIPTKMISHYWSEYADIRASIDYLERHDLVSLRAFIVEATESVISDIVKYTTEYFVRWFAERFKNLSEIINYYVQLDAANSTWSLRALTDKLPNDFPFNVKRYPEDSIVAVRILQNVNDNLERMANAQLQAVCNASAQAFVARADVRATIVQSGDLTELLGYLSSFDADVTFGNRLVISLLKHFGNRESIIESDLNHLATGDLLMSGLRMGIRLVYTAELERHFAFIATEMIANTDIVKFAVYDSLPEEARIPVNLLPHLIHLLARAGKMVELSFKFGIIFNNAKNYQYFATYFTERVAETFATRFAKVKGLIDKAQIMRAAMQEFEQQFVLKTFFHISGIENIFSLQDQFDAKYSSHESILSTYLFEQTRPIFNDKRYIKGDVKPGGYTALARMLLCQLLGIEHPLICMLQEATILDVTIAARFKANNIIFADIGTFPAVERLPVVDALPDTYGKLLTREIVMHCIAYWYGHYDTKFEVKRLLRGAKEQALMRLLIGCVKSNTFNEAGELSEQQSQVLRALILENRENEKAVLDLYDSADVTLQVAAALLRTSTLSNVRPTQIEFNALVRLFNLPVDLGAPSKATQEQVQAKIKELMHEFRSLNPEPVLNETELREKASLEVGEAATEQQIEHRFRELKREFNEGLPKPNVHDLMKRAKLEANASDVNQSVSLSHVQSRELARQGTFFYAKIGMNAVDKALLQIQKRHASAKNFNLDAEDINILRRMLHARWFALLGQFGNERDALKIYLVKPRRTDSVYIAIAELIAKYYRSSGQGNIYVATLLMPECAQFANLAGLRQVNVHINILKKLGLVEEKELVDPNMLFDEVIGVSDLVVTKSGYPLSMIYIINQYQLHRTLVNPYTGQNYTEEELGDIVNHVRCGELVGMIAVNHAPGLSKPLVDLLADLINGSVFNEGYDRYYYDKVDERDKNKGKNKVSEQAQAETAYIQFYKNLHENISKQEQKALMREPIPGDHLTIGDRLKRSADTCLTGEGTLMARVVIAYRGNVFHGLQPFIAKRAQAGCTIPPRAYGGSGEINHPAKQLELTILKLAKDKINVAPVQRRKP